MIMLPKAEGGKDVQHLGAKLAVHEAKAGQKHKCYENYRYRSRNTRRRFHMGSYQGASERLHGLTWGGGRIYPRQSVRRPIAMRAATIRSLTKWSAT